jgi:hypothetical protein
MSDTRSRRGTRRRSPRRVDRNRGNRTRTPFLAPCLVALFGVIAARSASAGDPICSCPGDAAGDGLVTIDDVLAALSQWGPCENCPPACAGDVNGDCSVDINDLLTMLANWGVCGGGASDPSGDSEEATDLGVLGDAPLSFCDAVPEDDVDVFRFTVDEHRSVSITVGERTDGVRVKLGADLNGDGRVDSAEDFDVTFRDHGDPINLTKDLSPGQWWIFVEEVVGPTSYRLLVTGGETFPTLAEDPPESAMRATEPGLVGVDGVVVRDHLDPYDRADVLQFSIDLVASVSVSLDDLVDRLRIRIYADLDGDGAVDGNERFFSEVAEPATVLSVTHDLTPGDYWILLFDDDFGDATRYTLDIAVAPLPFDMADDPGADPATAKDLGMVAGDPIEAVEVVAPFDRFDLHRVEFLDSRVVTLAVTEYPQPIEFGWGVDLDGDGTLDVRERFSTVPPSVPRVVTPGTWYLITESNLGVDAPGGRYRYTLTPGSPLPVVPGGDPGETLATANDLGDPTAGPVMAEDVISMLDPLDFHRIELFEPTELTVAVSGAMDNFLVEVCSDPDGDGVISGLECVFGVGVTPADVSVSGDLGPGVHWVRIRGDDDVSTPYRLELFTAPIPISTPRDPGETLDTALPLAGSAGEPVIVEELYDLYDRRDIYAYDAGDGGPVSILVSGRIDGGRLEIGQDLDGNGLIDERETLVIVETFDEEDLVAFVEAGPGPLFITVEQRSVSDASRYRLRIFQP